jgi:hypothetical protein
MTKSSPVLLLFFVGLQAVAADYPTRIATMGNVDSGIVDSLNARCDSEDDGESLSCIFTTVSIDHKLAPGEGEAIIESFDSDVLQGDNSSSTVEEVFSDDGSCGGKFLDEIDDMGRGLVEEYRMQLEETCASEKNVTNARDLLQLESEVEARTCMVWATSGETTFSRSAPGRWSLQTEPSGNCQVYDVVELNCDEAGYHCDYDEHAIYSVTEGEFCEGFKDVVDEGDHFSWRVARKMELNCDFVQFWFE